MQPASREQIVAIIRQRAERHRGALAAAVAAGDVPLDPGGANGVGNLEDRLPMPGARGMPPFPGIRMAAAAAAAAGPVGAHGPGGPMMGPLFRQASLAREEEDSHRSRNLAVQGDFIGHSPSHEHPDAPGVYVGGKSLW